MTCAEVFVIMSELGSVYGVGGDEGSIRIAHVLKTETTVSVTD